MSLRSGLALSREAAAWSLRFYRQHFATVFVLSMIPTAQRFVAVRWEDQLPAVANLAGEIVTGLVRLVLFYAIYRLAFGADPVLAGLSHRERWRLLGRFADSRRTAFYSQLLVLGAAFVVLDLAPNTAIAQLVPTDSQQLAQSILVSAKNPTVIALTLIWMIGAARLMMRAMYDSSHGPAGNVATRVDPGRGSTPQPGPDQA